MSSALNITQDEINRFQEAMKKEEFRKLLIEYVEEISDPKNREQYEQEITKLEEERGIDVIFIYPEPGYCIKTFQKDGNKFFINICKNLNIEKPLIKRDLNNNNSGYYWKIPHSCSPVREDFEKSSNELCKVCDVVFHPDAYRMGETCESFNNLLNETAIDTIEKNFNVKLDKKDYKVLKNMKFKGKPSACVIRKLKKELNCVERKKSIQNQIKNISDKPKTEHLNHQSSSKNLKEKKMIDQNELDENKFVQPIYKIIYSNQTDLQDYANLISKNSVKSTRPKEIKISIELPNCKSSADLNLDIFEKRIFLVSRKYFYKLDINLSYSVNEKETKAKFDKSKKVLNVILPVLQWYLINEKPLDQFIEMNEENDKNLISSNLQLSNIKKKNSDILQDIKFLMPINYEIFRFHDLLKISILEENYDENSIELKIVNNSLVLNYECISKSGSYLNYYKAYFLFLKSEKIFIFPNSNQSFQDAINIRKMKDKIEIDISNDDDNDDAIICMVSSTEIKEYKTPNLKSESFKIYTIKKEPQENEIFFSNKNSIFEKASNFSNQKNNSDDKNCIIQCSDKIQENIIDSSTYFPNFKNQQGKNVILNSSINGTFLKGILKKSISDEEVNPGSSYESNINERSLEICSIKKSVSFSKQIVRNIFKPGSTITGMKKPNSSKNKKKCQKRNRTLSDPCQSISEISDDMNKFEIKLRQRVLSESNFVANTTDNMTEFDNFLNPANKKKNNEDKKKEYDLEKIIQIKCQREGQIEEQHKDLTKCAFKFRNKITELLDE